MGDILRKENTPLPRYFTSLSSFHTTRFSFYFLSVPDSLIAVVRASESENSAEQLEPITKQQQYMMLLRCINTGRSLSNLLQKKKVRGGKEKKTETGRGKRKRAEGEGLA